MGRSRHADLPLTGDVWYDARMHKNEFSQRQENQDTVKTKSLGVVMGNQGGDTTASSPMNIGALMHQGGEKKHENEAYRKANSLINHI